MTPSGQSPSAPIARDSPRAGEDQTARAVGPGHRHAARHLSGAHEQGHRRCVQPGRLAPADGLGRRDGAPVGRQNGPGGRSRLTTAIPARSSRPLQPRRAMGRLGGRATGPSGCGGRRAGRTWRSCTATRGPCTTWLSPRVAAGWPPSVLASELNLGGGRHGAGLGCGPPGDLAGAARPHEVHLPGGLSARTAAG